MPLPNVQIQLICALAATCLSVRRLSLVYLATRLRVVRSTRGAVNSACVYEWKIESANSELATSVPEMCHQKEPWTKSKKHKDLFWLYFIFEFNFEMKIYNYLKQYGCSIESFVSDSDGQNLNGLNSRLNKLTLFKQLIQQNHLPRCIMFKVLSPFGRACAQIFALVLILEMCKSMGCN